MVLWLGLIASITACDEQAKTDGGYRFPATISAVETAGDARYVMTDLAQNVILDALVSFLPVESDFNTIMDGISGTAGVQGFNRSYFVSCDKPGGSGCTGSIKQNNVYLTVVFDHYIVDSTASTKTTLTGTVLFDDDSWSAEFNAGVGGIMKISGESVQYRVENTTGGGYADTITFSAQGVAPDRLVGTCTTAANKTIEF